MFNKRLAVFVMGVIISLISLVGMSGCEVEQMKGRISISGSTTVLPVSNKLADAFQALYPEVTFQINGGGSAYGISQVAAGSVDIGAISRELEPSEPVLQQRLIGRDGIAVVVHPSNPVNDLSRDQIIDLFSGAIQDWSAVGGKNLPVTPVSREAGSGTLTAFHELVMGETRITDSAVVEPGNNDVLSFVSINPEAVGFLSVSYLNSGVRAVRVDSIECSTANCQSGRYPFVRPLYYLTRDNPEGLIMAFLDMAVSKQGQKIVVNEGYISIR